MLCPSYWTSVNCSWAPGKRITVRYEDPPLFEAVKYDNTGMVKLLLSRGASLKDRNLVGHTLLHTTTEYNAQKVFDLIVTDAPKDEVDQQGNTALHYAVNYGHVNLTARLLAAGADVNATNTRMVTPQHLAVRRGRVDIARMLLVNGKADPNTKDYTGNTPLLDAIVLDEASFAEEEFFFFFQSGATVVEEQPERIHVALAQLLLSHGADVNVENDTSGYSPLHQALRDGYERTAAVLLARGADEEQVWGDTVACGCRFRREC
ncbi:hypothetical protein L916_06578 [Phytophthora nicotianae]|uniref:Uncharacterized protein n=1 Tax=Phytophthora nicotianae TaxID=4792 RepID=W2J8A5_PHYNI|nr:hypothetical protein L916_06578 [Phytophthora nicotianae]